MQDFRIPARVSISADRQVRVYPVSEEAFDTELVARAVMSVDPTARLEAAFHYARETPIEAGRLQLYRDGAYVGCRQSAAAAAGFGCARAVRRG